MNDGLARQVRRQGFTHGLCLRGCFRRHGRCRDFCLARLELFDGQLELLDTFIENFRGAPELHPSQLRQEQLQVLDLKVPGAQCRATLEHEPLETLDIIGQIGAAVHERYYTAERAPDAREKAYK